MGETSIEWTAGADGRPGKTWNPVRGCVKISPGCKFCYAETFAERWRGVNGHPYKDGFDPRLAEDQLGEPFGWKAPRNVFVNSMSDLFLKMFVDYFSDYLIATFGVMSACPQHTFQVLTKRADLMREMVWRMRMDHYDPTVVRRVLENRLYADQDRAIQLPLRWPLPNVHLGVSVEDRKYGLPRVDLLRDTPAAVRFLSIEPLLEDIASDLNLKGIDQVIVGGESGHGARPFNVDWARKILAACRKQRVPFFFKQVGHRPFRTWQPDDRQGLRIAGIVPLKIASAKGNKLPDIPEDLRVRERVGHYGKVS